MFPPFKFFGTEDLDHKNIKTVETHVNAVADTDVHKNKDVEVAKRLQLESLQSRQNITDWIISRCLQRNGLC